MKLRIALVAVFTLFLSCSFAQKNYKAGYIIPLQGDTVHGFINDRSWSKNPDIVSFRKTLDDAETNYNPSSIKAFGLTGRVYISAVIDVEEVDVNRHNIRLVNGDFKIHSDTTFLQTLLGASKSLYLFQDEQGVKRFYIPADNGKFLLLGYRVFFEEKSGPDLRAQGSLKKVTESNVYKGQLRDYLKDCPGVAGKMRELRYDQSSLEGIFNFYYKCTNTNVTYVKKKEKLKIEAGVLAGMTQNRLTFSGSDTYSYLINSGKNAGTSFTPGIYCGLIVPGNLNRFMILTEAMVTSFKISSTTHTEVNDERYSDISTNIKQSSLKLNALLRYQYPVGKAYLFLNGGVTFGFVMKSTNYKKQIDNYYGTIFTAESKAIDPADTQQIGFILGAGVRYGHLSVEARLDEAYGPSSTQALSSSMTRSSLFLGYRIF